jgi:alpha-beta hydrolase superfamily lysophospholipase
MPSDQVMQYFHQLQDESYRAFLDMLGFNLAKPKRVAVPICVVGAVNDAIFSPFEVEATARAYDTTATIFPMMAHDMMLEPGWQAVADTMLAWLNKQGF